MSAFNVEEYFLQIEPQLEESAMIGGPVVTPDHKEIGKIRGYNSDTGFARIKLFNTISYKDLIVAGIPLEHIIFKGEA